MEDHALVFERVKDEPNVLNTFAILNHLRALQEGVDLIRNRRPGRSDWMIVRVTRRAAYMAALEDASSKGNIAEFTRFLAGEMQVDWTNEFTSR